LIYKVIVQDSAAADARDYAIFLLEESKNQAIAARWLDELETVIAGLSDMPKRYKLIDEQEGFVIELRQLLHYAHRVIYHVDETERLVHIVRIYHGAKQPLSLDDDPL